MKLLVVGRGGREHALCWKLAQSKRVTIVYCAPGNAGTARESKVQNLAIEPDETRRLLEFAKREAIDLTVVGPEDPLVNGITDAFIAEGLRLFGPKANAAMLEGSKAFAKEMMRHAGIPTADHRLFRSAPDAEQYVLSREVSLVVRPQGRSARQLVAPPLCRTIYEALEAIDRHLGPHASDPCARLDIEAKGTRSTFEEAVEARRYVLQRPLGIVVKADGLAAGKGVTVCHNAQQALEAIDRVMVRRQFGRAGSEVLLEERLDGQEASLIALCDGQTILTLETSQDYKRAFAGDRGPNTGGMGAYSPADQVIGPDRITQVEREILVPLVHAMKRRRRPIRGVMYAGLMLTNQGPKVLEFNVRFGDPEIQVLLYRLQSDLVDLLEAVVEGRLIDQQIHWDPRPAITVVLASGGYPDAYEKGREIRGLAEAAEVPGVKVFHAGTALKRLDEESDPVVVTDGGRVLNVTAIGETLQDARDRAYKAVRLIRFKGVTYRDDIAHHALSTS